MKVLHLPTSVGGNAWGLSQAERALGLDSKTLYVEQSWLHYPGDFCLANSNESKWRILAARLKAVLTIPRRFDVLHFNFGSTLIDFPNHGFDLLDLPLYRRQKLFVTYNGCDARMKYRRMEITNINACQYPDCYGGRCNNPAMDRQREKRIRTFQQSGAHFFALNPDLMWNLPAESVFLPYTIASWDNISAVQPPRRLSDPITIMHAPTNRVCKGSDAVIAACQRLEKKYPGRVSLRLVEHVPHEKALAMYQEADIIVDQLRLGWYGAFAVEAMKMGKPVAVYIEPKDLQFIPAQMAQELPEAVIQCNEFDLEAVLERYIQQPDLLEHKRQAGLEYVYKWHLPAHVAEITKQAYEHAMEDG